MKSPTVIEDLSDLLLMLTKIGSPNSVYGLIIITLSAWIPFFINAVSSTSPQVSESLCRLVFSFSSLGWLFSILPLCLRVPRRKHLDLVFLIESAILSLFVDELRLFKCPVVTDFTDFKHFVGCWVDFFFLLCEDQEFSGCCVEHQGLFLFSFVNLFLSRKLLLPVLFQLRQSFFLP